MTKPSGRRTREKRSKEKTKGLVNIEYSVFSEIITCPRCGFEMALWSGEEETRCFVCGHRFFRREATIH